MDVFDSQLSGLAEEITHSVEVEAGDPIDLSDHTQVPEALEALLLAGQVNQSNGNRDADSDHDVGISVRQLGDFRILRELGRGGMGVVYEAEQVSIGRRVALKVLPFAALLDDRCLQRFRNEVRAAAALDHPHVVSVYSIGKQQGVHFYAMQLIRGQTLANAIFELQQLKRRTVGSVHEPGDTAPAVDSTPTVASAERIALTRFNTLTNVRSSTEAFRTTARLGIQAAEALQHAHDLGVLHRDIKPSNLLLDREGKLFVTDFGLARIGADAGLTMTGDIVGTLRYMPPEQALGKRVVVDQRADIYSLGATLYEMLALQPAFDAPDRGELLRQIAFEEPLPLRKVDRRIPAEMEIIVAKAMAKQPEERYQTAQQLADDLRAFLDNRPITANSPTIVRRVAKWSRRHHKLMTLSVTSLLLLTGILAASVMLINRARMQALVALDESSNMLYTSDIASAFQAWGNGWGDEVQEILKRQRPAPGGRDRRGFEWHVLDSLVGQPEPLALAGHQGPVHEIAVLPRRRWLASAGEDGTLRLWDTTTGTLLKTIALCPEPLYSVAVSPDERYVAAGSHTAYLCDLKNECVVCEIYRSDDPLDSLAFSPDGEHLAVGSIYAEVCLLNLKGEVVNRVPSEARIESLDFMRQNSLLLVPNRRPAPDSNGPGYVQVWRTDLARLEKELEHPELQDSRITVARSFPSEEFIAAGRRYEANVFIFHLASNRVVAETPAFRAYLTDLANSPNGEKLAVAYRNGAVELFDLQPRGESVSINERSKIIKAHRGEVRCTRFLSSDALATCGSDGFIRVWKTGATASENPLSSAKLWAGPLRLPWKKPPRSELCSSLKLSPDGSLLLYIGDRETLVYDTKSGELIQHLPVRGPKYDGSAWSPSGKRFALCRQTESRVEVVDLAGQNPFFISHESRANDVAFSPGDNLMAVVGEQQLQLCRADNGAEVFSQALSSPGLTVDFSHHGSQLAYGGLFEGIVLFDSTERKVLRELPGGIDTHALAFSPDDTLLAAGDGDGVIRIWETRTGRLRAELVGHVRQAIEVAFSPDGRTLISASADGTVRLWSVELGRSYGSLYGNLSARRLSFSSDGHHFAIADRDQHGLPEVLLWHMQLGNTD